MIMKNLFYVVVVLVAAVLVVLSLNSKEKSYAVIAEVEAEKTAISFHKPVRVKNLHVSPGQHVKMGDILLELERPDLELDIEKLKNEQYQLESSLEKLEMDFSTNERLESLRHRQQISEIDGQMLELKSQQTSDSLFYSEVSEWAGIDSTKSEQTLADIKMANLQEEKKLESRRYISEKDRQIKLYTKDLQSFHLRNELLDKELISLLDEQNSLIQYAAFDGTIGTVSVQLMELIPPYQTIMSVYDENPNMIKAYMSEVAEVIFYAGDEVVVESMNREYQIHGKIVEIGSRIVSYERQMNPVGQVEMWGKEVFVQIPEQNNFLNGEKVYVIINPKL